MLLKNFNRHYKSNKAPFGLFYHSAWFNTGMLCKNYLPFFHPLLLIMINNHLISLNSSS